MCRELVVILSPASVESRNVMDEVAFALEEGKAIIPVVHKDCRIPFRLRRLQYVDFKSDHSAALKSLVSALEVEGHSIRQDSPGSDGFPINQRKSVNPEPANGVDNQVATLNAKMLCGWIRCEMPWLHPRPSGPG